MRALRPTAPGVGALPRRPAAVVARGILDSYRRERGLAVDSPPTADGPPTPPVDGDADGGCAVTWTGDTVCSIGCVGEVETPADLDAAHSAAGADALVVVDFYKTACGACR